MIEGINSRGLAVFDFDGTLTTRDTLNDLLAWEFGLGRVFWRFLILAPWMALYLIKISPNQVAKQKLFAAFFAGMPGKTFEALCGRYSLSRIDQLVQPAAMARVRWHQQQKHQVIILSASLENWIQPWAARQGFDAVLATRAELQNGLLTGRFSTLNCYGPEKVRRLLELFPQRNEYSLYAYGDSRGDRELLAFADYGYYRRFE
jgi:phosphatidylglycerophosphatase C